MSLLDHLFTHYGTDKNIWGYVPAYEKHLDRERIKNVLEIGICGYRDIPNNVVGASLFAWRDYFPNAMIYGVDNDRRFIFNDQDRIRTFCADAYTPDLFIEMIRTVNPIPRFDFICDDAVHEPMAQVLLCSQLWPFLEVGGVYAIEEACPYKLPGNSLEMMVKVLFMLADDMDATEYRTHKDEQLLILTKRPL